MSIDYDRLRELAHEHTPGPWEVEEFEEQYAGCPPTTKFYLGSDDFQNIATAETTERHYDQTRANFALIALAPDMARELLRLRDELGDLRDTMHAYADRTNGESFLVAADYAHRITQVLQGDTE